MAERRTLPPNLHSHEYGGIPAPPRFVFLPAYTVLPLLRAPLGYDIVRVLPAMRRALGLIVVPLVIEAIWVGFGGHLPDNMGHTYLAGFALVYFAATLVFFGRRWYGQQKGEELHSGEAGYSWLARYSTLPVPLCELLIVPLAVLAIGYALVHSVSIELGWWLIVSGFSLCLMGLWEHRRTWSQRRATVDDLVRAKVFEARVDRQAATPGRPPPAASKDGPDFADLA